MANSNIPALLHTLTNFPNRAAGSKYAKETELLLADILHKEGFEVSYQNFTAPSTYIPIVYQITGGVIVGLLLTKWVGWIGMGLVCWSALNGLAYFDWRASAFLYTIKSNQSMANIVGKFSPVNATKKLVLMAHFDTAPISALYKNQTKHSFQNTLRLSMLFIFLAIPLSIFSYYFPANMWLNGLQFLMIVYFVGQSILGTMGYWQNGFTNGASDNATGVVAALETAKNLQAKIKNTAIEVVFTNAEEAGMIGAYHYWKHLQKTLNDKSQQIYLINFDTLGGGTLRYITKTGSFTDITYNNIITETAYLLTTKDDRFKHIKSGSWHTADFDSAWFVRAGIPCVTLAALDEHELMPRIHRPEDVLEYVDTTPMYDAINLAEAIALQLDK